MSAAGSVHLYDRWPAENSSVTAGRAKAEDLVADAVRRGARGLVGGTTPEGPGCFSPPTVLTDVSPDSRPTAPGVSPDSRLTATEIFGPVAEEVPGVPVRGAARAVTGRARAGDVGVPARWQGNAGPVAGECRAGDEEALHGHA